MTAAPSASNAAATVTTVLYFNAWICRSSWLSRAIGLLAVFLKRCRGHGPDHIRRSSHSNFIQSIRGSQETYRSWRGLLARVFVAPASLPALSPSPLFSGCPTLHRLSVKGGSSSRWLPAGSLPLLLPSSRPRLCLRSFCHPERSEGSALSNPKPAAMAAGATLLPSSRHEARDPSSCFSRSFFLSVVCFSRGPKPNSTPRARLR